VQRKTIDDLHAMPGESRIYELIRGEIIVAASPSEPHLEATKELFYLLTPLDRVHRLGMVYIAPFEVHLPTGDVVEPDLFSLSTERWSLRKRTHIEGAPDLMMEIVSRSSRTRDRVVKREIYEASRVQEYWIVDLRERSIQALSLRDGRYEAIPHDGTIVRSRLFSVFEVADEALFSSLTFWGSEAE